MRLRLSFRAVVRGASFAELGLLKGNMDDLYDVMNTGGNDFRSWIFGPSIYLALHAYTRYTLRIPIRLLQSP